MNGSIGEPWPLYTITVLALLGAGLAVHGLRRLAGGLGGPTSDPASLLIALRGFRMAVIGLALVGVAAAWLWGQVWLLVLSLGIAGEETLESSVMIWAQGRERRPGTRYQRSRHPI